MSARTHPRLVGAFVLGAVALVLGAVLALSSADWFERRARFSMYFPGASVRGLDTGAPVTFRGIKVGEVVEVKALATGQASPPVQIEVVAELVGEVIETPPGVAPAFSATSPAEFVREFTAKGLRGRLMSQSLLTGQKYVDFDILPEEPPRFSGLRPRYPELPTTPTAMERLGTKAEDFMNKLAELPLDQMLENLRKTLESARTLLDSPDLRGTLAGARRTVDALPATLADVRAAVADARRVMDALETETRTTAGDARETIRSARGALDRVEGTMQALQSTARGTDDARVRASQTLEELDRTLKALRNLVDYVQTHPEAVVLGKPEGAKR
jgi:paraquat-inducible protein B